MRSGDRSVHGDARAVSVGKERAERLADAGQRWSGIQDPSAQHACGSGLGRLEVDNRLRT